MLFIFGKCFFKIIFKVFFRLRIIGAENVPEKGPMLLCANHQSFIDPPLAGVALPRGLYFMARHDLFTIPVFGKIISRVHAFPVKRSGAGDPTAFKHIFRLLEQGRAVLVFPEGTRSKDGNLQRGMPGAGFIAYHAKVPVIPCYIYGSWDVLPRNRNMVRFHQLKVFFGSPVCLEKYYLQEKNKATYQEISNAIMAEIAGLKKKYAL